MGIEGVAFITVEADMLMHQNHGAWPVALLCLVSMVLDLLLKLRMFLL
jgi:hypothetical protein